MASFLAASSLLVVTLTLVMGQQTCPQPDTTLSASYVNCKVLSSNHYELYWTYNEATVDLRIAAHVRTSGWLGLGISPDGGMKDSDIAIGWVGADGMPVLNVRTCVCVTGCWLVGAMMGHGPYYSSPVSYRLEMPMETEMISRCVVRCVLLGVCFYVLLCIVLLNVKPSIL